MNEYAVITAPFGRLGIRTREDILVEIRFLDDTHPLQAPEAGGLAAEAVSQIDAYFLDPAFCFNLPFQVEGSAFQRRVWEQISRIPSGQTKSYREIAELIGSAPRAIGGACGRNPLPLVVPCHRVVSSSGLGGFMQSSGRQTVSIKEWLLAHERCR